ncbi:MAG: hypothetical protein LUC22_01390 [Prevotella sp.]|nr:hypothetical protein [Prevotella sp.]
MKTNKQTAGETATRVVTELVEKGAQELIGKRLRVCTHFFDENPRPYIEDPETEYNLVGRKLNYKIVDIYPTYTGENVKILAQRYGKCSGTTMNSEEFSELIQKGRTGIVDLWCVNVLTIIN